MVFIYHHDMYGFFYFYGKTGTTRALFLVTTESHRETFYMTHDKHTRFSRTGRLAAWVSIAALALGTLALAGCGNDDELPPMEQDAPMEEPAPDPGMQDPGMEQEPMEQDPGMQDPGMEQEQEPMEQDPGMQDPGMEQEQEPMMEEDEQRGF
jgi:hypothetical protein